MVSRVVPKFVPKVPPIDFLDCGARTGTNSLAAEQHALINHVEAIFDTLQSPTIERFRLAGTAPVWLTLHLAFLRIIFIFQIEKQWIYHFTCYDFANSLV